MTRQGFFELLNKYDLELKETQSSGNLGILRLYYANMEICEVLKADYDRIFLLDFDDEILQIIISNLCFVTEQELNLQAFTFKAIYRNFLDFQRELKDYDKRQELMLNRILDIDDDAPLFSKKEEKESETLVVSSFSNVTLFLLLGIIVLLAIIFELRMQMKDDEMQTTMQQLQNKIILLQTTLQETESKDVITKNKGAKIEQLQKVEEIQQEPLFKIPQVGNKKELTSFVEDRASSFGIDPKIVKTIINIESKNNPFAMGIISENAQAIAMALSNNDNITISSPGKGKLVSIVAKDEDTAKALYDVVQSHKNEWKIVTVDYGLMQVNHDTILSYELDPKEIYINQYYNIAVGIDVLKSCFNMFPKNQFNTIECYNKGVDKKKLDNSDTYYNKFIAEYKRIGL